MTVVKYVHGLLSFLGLIGLSKLKYSDEFWLCTKLIRQRYSTTFISFHITLIVIDFSQAHELAHQWFGDLGDYDTEALISDLNKRI